jgi:hypothetical protein
MVMRDRGSRIRRNKGGMKKIIGLVKEEDEKEIQEENAELRRR